MQQLLTLARNEPGTEPRRDERVDLAAVARDVVAEQAAIADAKGVEVGLAADDAFPLQGDPEALHILVGNLVDNAVRYTPSGGSVEVAVRRAGERTELVVSDTGPGIPPEARTRVFDRFYRHDTTTGTGSGLGLAIVHEIVQRHGASISLGDASPAGGLAVTVTFPPARLAR